MNRKSYVLRVMDCFYFQWNVIFEDSKISKTTKFMITKTTGISIIKLFINIYNDFST